MVGGRDATAQRPLVWPIARHIGFHCAKGETKRQLPRVLLLNSIIPRVLQLLNSFLYIVLSCRCRLSRRQRRKSKVKPLMMEELKTRMFSFERPKGSVNLTDPFCLDPISRSLWMYSYLCSTTLELALARFQPSNLPPGLSHAQNYVGIIS
jgi:hypothetical protein